jgi:hypothetical protein
MAFELLATVCAGMFAGAAVYINLVEHPARIECGTALAIREFAPSYRRAAILQGSLAVLGFVAATVAWLSARDPWILAGGLLLGSVVPFTLLIVARTNKRIMDPDLDAESIEAAGLLQRWGTLHAVRSVLGTAAFLVFLIRFSSP